MITSFQKPDHRSRVLQVYLQFTSHSNRQFSNGRGIYPTFAFIWHIFGPFVSTPMTRKLFDEFCHYAWFWYLMGCHAIRHLDEVAGHVNPIRSKGLGDVLEIYYCSWLRAGQRPVIIQWCWWFTVAVPAFTTFGQPCALYHLRASTQTSCIACAAMDRVSGNKLPWQLTSSNFRLQARLLKHSNK